MLSFLKCRSGSHRSFEPKGLKHTQLLLFKGLFICISNLFSVFYGVYSSKVKGSLTSVEDAFKIYTDTSSLYPEGSIERGKGKHI